MKTYQKVAFYGMLTLGCLSFIKCGAEAEAKERLEQKNISGIVKSEFFKKRQAFDIMDGSYCADKYSFSLKTDKDIKIFSCVYSNQASEMNALLEPKDSVDISIIVPSDKNNNFEIALEHIVGVNGTPFNYNN